MPEAVIVDESPGFTVDGFAEQLTVGGSKALTMKISRAVRHLAGLRAFRYVALDRVGSGAKASSSNVRRAAGAGDRTAGRSPGVRSRLLRIDVQTQCQ